MNRTQIIGNIGSDATVNQTQTGRVAIGFSVAVSKKWTDASGQQQEQTTWFRCTIWKKAGESTNVAQYLRKGTKVFCEGEVSAKMYTDASGGNQTSLELNVIGATLELLGQPQQAAAPPAAYPAQQPRPAPAPTAYPAAAPQQAYPQQAAPFGQFAGGIPEDDLPF